ncbi:putative 2-carboxy-D-arabinitol-1-phosphatase [Frankliniella fusca]|uniref:2-carboxy-D-arabinitol-1-phosphatase n=1 Tax=Frankliniella fusca TaxID=407009 RepID=A0AAE1LEW1_9NEOP|nr:putative 2-carboxy-D-arabinitol-1-phosphatase [Frankliniella fusca]
MSRSTSEDKAKKRTRGYVRAIRTSSSLSDDMIMTSNSHFCFFADGAAPVSASSDPPGEEQEACNKQLLVSVLNPVCFPTNLPRVTISAASLQGSSWLELLGDEDDDKETFSSRRGCCSCCCCSTLVLAAISPAAATGAAERVLHSNGCLTRKWPMLNGRVTVAIAISLTIGFPLLSQKCSKSTTAFILKGNNIMLPNAVQENKMCPC